MGLTHHHGHHQDESLGKAKPHGNERALALAMLLTGSFMTAEVLGGWLSGSLALFADAGHMLTDFASLGLAWFAFRLSRRPADRQRTFGFDRFTVLAAFVSGLSLFLIAGWICFEAVKRFQEPVEVLGGLMMGVAMGGFFINLACYWVLSRQQTNNLNIRAAALHVAGDLLGSVAAIIASLVIIYTGWMIVDPLLSVLVALILLRSAWMIVFESGHILLEGAPKGFDQEKIAHTLVEEIPQVQAVSNMHAWCLTQERTFATLEVEVEFGADLNLVTEQVKRILASAFGIQFSTVEVHMADAKPQATATHFYA